MVQEPLPAKVVLDSEDDTLTDKPNGVHIVGLTRVNPVGFVEGSIPDRATVALRSKGGADKVESSS